MTKFLRKRHRQVWCALLVTLPIGIIFSWLAIPNQSPVKLLQSNNIGALPIVLKTEELPAFTINLRSDELHQQWQLEWINKLVLRVPTAVIYQVSDTSTDISKARLIGRIETSGTYLFPLIGIDSLKAPRFILYDFIHQQIIDHINFKP
jgi:hypothetical protein